MTPEGAFREEWGEARHANLGAAPRDVRPGMLPAALACRTAHRRDRFRAA